jgi:hypothetical protein
VFLCILLQNVADQTLHGLLNCTFLCLIWILYYCRGWSFTNSDIYRTFNLVMNHKYAIFKVVSHFYAASDSPR